MAVSQGILCGQGLDCKRGGKRGYFLGPCPCSACGTPLFWNGQQWSERYGIRHRCRGAKAA